MTSRPLVILGVLLIIVAVIAGAGYVLHEHREIPIIPADSQLSPAFPSDSATTTADDMDGNASSGALSASASSAISLRQIPLPASTTIDHDSWPLYVDSESRFSIEYPPDFVPGSDPSSFALAIPNTAYFHWPLLDTAKITVSVEPSCPALSVKAVKGSAIQPAISYSENGFAFKRTVGTSTSAAKSALEIADDVVSKGQCYHIDLYDQGLNGAESSVDDQSLAAQYDAQHSADLSALFQLYAGMIGTFHILAQ